MLVHYRATTTTSLLPHSNKFAHQHHHLSVLHVENWAVKFDHTERLLWYSC